MGIFLTPTELKDSYFESEKWTDDWQRPFDEYERIAGNKLSKALSKNMPKVNDGSLAASLLETPMQVLPSMQNGKFIPANKKNAWLGEIANIIWRTRIVPNANTQSSFFDKEQIALYRALKYGAQPRYNFFVSTERYTGSDWSLPHIKNVKLEPGKYSVEDSDYVFLDVYYTKLQLKKIIDNIKESNKKTKAEGGEPDNSWNTESLQKLADMALTSKEIEDQNINERDKQVNASGIKTTICFNRGIDAPFYMFSKHLEDGELLREWDNPDPTGDLPITMQYCYETLESPYGIGRVELAGPTQNVLDFFTQAHVLATQLGLQPPKKISGSTDNTNLNSIVSAPDALWMLGQAQIDVVETTSHVYSQFPSNYGLYKSQLMNLQGRSDGSVSAESGNPQFSKTPQGIKQQVDRTNTQDNYLRNKADTASAKMATKMMNVHMAQMQGADILDIAEEDKERLEKAGYFNDNPTDDIPSVNDIEILYDEIRDTFQFEFNARPETDENEKSRWIEILDIVSSNPNIIPMLLQSGYKLDLGEVFKKIITNSGADGWDKVLIKLEPEKVAGAVDPATGQPINQPVDPPGIPIQGATDGLGGQPDPTDPMSGETDMSGVNPDDPEHIQAIMDDTGLPEDVAKTILFAMSKGYSEQEIVQALQKNGHLPQGVTNA